MKPVVAAYDRNTPRTATCFCLIAMLFLLPSTADCESISSSDAATRLNRLVEQLGADEFVIRERAKEQLSLQGVEAFDVLFDALRHPDLEVRIQAKSLIRSISIEWTTPTDSDTVREILDSYHKQNRSQRAASIRRLQDIGDQEAIGKLCQIVRFETSEYLSKLAAIRVIESSVEGGEDELRDRVKNISNTLRLSRRQGARWLRTYNRHLLNPEAVADQWRHHLVSQLDAVRFSTDESQRILVRDFARWQMKMFSRIGRPEQIANILENIAPRFISSQAELTELIDWLIKNQVSDEMHVIQKQFEPLVGSNALLHFTLARFYDQFEEPEHSKSLSNRAFQLIREATPDERIDVAENLVSRGWIHWAEQALQELATQADPASDEGARARVLLGMMFYDWGQFEKSSSYLKPIATLIETDRIFERTIAMVSDHTPRSLRCHYYFSLGLFHREQGNTAEEIKNLELAWNSDRSNVDALIAMFRTNSDDQDWKDGVLAQIKAKIDQYDIDVKGAMKSYEKRQSALETSSLALAYNQYAWLVSNTIGDRELARQRSEKSLKLIPNSASYLDTLARCFYALGEYEKAVEHQNHAAELQPESGQIQRQLMIFEKALTGRPSQQEQLDSQE